MRNRNRQEIDFGIRKNPQEIDFVRVVRLQYEASTLRKNDSEIRVSIKPDFQEKILDFGLDLRKKVSGKSTWNRFWK